MAEFDPNQPFEVVEFDPNQPFEKVPERPEVAQAQAGIREALEDAQSPTLSAIGSGVVDWARDVATGQRPLVDLPIVTPLADRAAMAVAGLTGGEAGRQAEAQHQAQLYENIVGNLLSGTIGSGVTGAAQGAALAELPVLGQAAGNVLANRAVGAADTLAQGGGMEDVVASQKSGKAALLDILTSALPLARASAPKVASTITGRSEEALRKYAQDPARFDAAPTAQDLVDEIRMQAEGVSGVTQAQRQALSQQQNRIAEQLTQELLTAPESNATQFLRQQAGISDVNNPYNVSERMFQAVPEMLESPSGNFASVIGDLGSQELMDMLAKYRQGQAATRAAEQVESRAAGLGRRSEPLVRRALSDSASSSMPGSSGTLSRTAATEELAQAIDPNIIEAARIREAATSSSGPRGSRLVNLFSMLGSPLGDFGRMVGAGLGAAADYTGGAGLIKAADKLRPLEKAAPAVQSFNREHMRQFLQSKYPQHFEQAQTPEDQDTASAQAAFIESSTPEGRQNLERFKERP